MSKLESLLCRSTFFSEWKNKKKLTKLWPTSIERIISSFQSKQSDPHEKRSDLIQQFYSHKRYEAVSRKNVLKTQDYHSKRLDIYKLQISQSYYQKKNSRALTNLHLERFRMLVIPSNKINLVNNCKAVINL